MTLSLPGNKGNPTVGGKTEKDSFTDGTPLQNKIGVSEILGSVDHQVNKIPCRHKLMRCATWEITISGNWKHPRDK